MFSIDASIAITLYNLTGRNPALDNLAVFFASYFQYLIIAVVAVVLLWQRSDRAQGLLILAKSFAAALISRFVFTEIIRFFFYRPRPFVRLNFEPLISHQATASYPSGHAAFFFAFSTIVFLHNRKLGWFCYLGSALISFGRMFAGVHYLSDILGGFGIGIFSALLIEWLAKRANKPSIDEIRIK